MIRSEHRARKLAHSICLGYIGCCRAMPALPAAGGSYAETGGESVLLAIDGVVLLSACITLILDPYRAGRPWATAVQFVRCDRLINRHTHH